MASFAVSGALSLPSYANEMSLLKYFDTEYSFNPSNWIRLKCLTQNGKRYRQAERERERKKERRKERDE